LDWAKTPPLSYQTEHIQLFTSIVSFFFVSYRVVGPLHCYAAPAKSKNLDVAPATALNNLTEMFKKATQMLKLFVHLILYD
jgi:hypothetical protein